MFVWFLSETTFPSYSVANNAISDLGTFCPTTGPCYLPPDWMYFDGSEVVLGLLVIVGAYYFYRAFRYKPVAVTLGVAGFGGIGIGLFNESFGVVHHIFSLVTFLLMGLLAMMTFRFQKPPLSYFSLLMGLITLGALILYAPNSGAYGTTMGIGPGGLERLIVYPVLLWGLGFGGHLMALEDPART